MIKSNLLPVETSGVSQEGTLVIELFLMTNYRFRRNILNGKVEFAILPDFLANLPEWDGQNHIADVFERLISVMQDSFYEVIPLKVA